MDAKNLVEKLVDKCLAAGADEAEVFFEDMRNLNIEVRNGEVETVQEAASHGVGFRVFQAGRMAFSHCNDLSEAALDNAAAAAVYNAATTTSDENNVLPDDKGSTEVGPLHDPGIAGVPMREKIDMAREIEALAISDPRITKSDGAGYAEGEGEIFIGNSHGLSKSYRESVCRLGVSVVAEKGEQKSSGGEYCARRFFSDLEPLKKIAEKAAYDAFSMLDPRMVKTQKAAVVFHPDAARAVLGGILAAIHGERVLQGASFLAKRLDKPVAGPLLTIIDDGTIQRGLATAPFDGEGVPVQKRVIVDQGVLKSFMYNTISAMRAGTRSTGNGSRGGFRSIPGIGPHCFYMAAGETPPEEIVKATKNGLLLKGVTGYGINPVSGNFSGGASGFWIENGRIAFPVKGLTIAGTADEMLNGIDMLGTDLDLTRTLTAPTFRIRAMQIGGS